jgi:hypothetical protein
MYEEGLTYSFYVNFIPDCIFHVLEKKFVHIHYETFNESTFLVGFKMITWKLDFFSHNIPPTFVPPHVKLKCQKATQTKKAKKKTES